MVPNPCEFLSSNYARRLTGRSRGTLTAFAPLSFGVGHFWKKYVKARLSAGSTERRQGTTLVGKNLCREAAYLNKGMQPTAFSGG